MTENEILQFLKGMKFKKAMFGADETDVYYQIRTLNYMYKELLAEYKEGSFEGDQNRRVDGESDSSMGTPASFVKSPEEYSASADEYHEKVEAVAKAFVDMQSQSESIVSTAEEKADRIIRDANAKAEEIVSQAEAKARKVLESGLKTVRNEEQKHKDEVKRLEQEKIDALEYLTEVRDIVNTLVPGCLAESKKQTARLEKSSPDEDIA